MQCLFRKLLFYSLSHILSQTVLLLDEAQYSRDRHVVVARYAVYAGLTVATCIIFQNNQKVAYGIGLAVALYITASEHFISQSNQNAGPKLPLNDM